MGLFRKDFYGNVEEEEEEEEEEETLSHFSSLAA